MKQYIRSESCGTGYFESKLTSFVFKLGVDRDELEPERDGGRSADVFELLPPGLSFPLRPMLSRDSL